MVVSSFAYGRSNLDERLPRFYFHLVRGQERMWDLEGIEVPRDLFPEGLARLVSEIKAERPDLVGSQEGWMLEVVDDTGRVVQTVEL
jgi:hypothetical protein